MGEVGGVARRLIAGDTGGGSDGQHVPSLRRRRLMRRPRRRQMHYYASGLHDGTVLAAYPIRKPAPRIMRRDGMRVDADGITQHRQSAGEWLRDDGDERRFRFQDILANALNSRRALRELVLPQLEALAAEVAALRAEVARLNESRPSQANR